MTNNWRIIHTEPLDPFQNMAMDEAIFRQYLQDRTPVFRTYNWSVPSVSLGVSQKPEEVLDLGLCEKEKIPYVRRMTGGGMIFHEDEITYSLACSREEIGCGGTIAGSFKIICSFLIDFYRRLGLDAGFAVDRAGAGSLGVSCGFCFAAKEKYDIVIGKKKIGGNAQKRTRDAIFQHGSIPISLDRARAVSFLKEKPAVQEIAATSLEELMGRSPGREELVPLLRESFEKTIVAAGGRAHLSVPYQRRPSWLNKKISLSGCAQVKSSLRGLSLATVCEEASCPNIGECFEKGEATFLILGKVCTRGCAFCGVAKGRPELPDPDTPARVASGVKRLGLKYVVVTSVTRDDLPDGGASVFCDTIAAIRRVKARTKIEVLIPDFGAGEDPIRRVARASPDAIAHNVETVPRLYPAARRGAGYERSLEVLRLAGQFAPRIPVKSGIMLGLGEREEEVLEVFGDLLNAGCSFLSIGQYLAPTKSHMPVAEYVAPGKFDHYKKEALGRGFKYVMSGPYVRSSYLADRYM